jgi:DNA gyrase subunit A
VKKSRLSEYDSVRSGGLIAVNLREDDEVISAALVSPEQDVLLVSKGAQALRFNASDEQLRPMGRATSGVIGMRFNEGDELLGMYVVREGEDVLVATDRGYAKRTPIDDYPLRGRGGLGVITARIVEDRGGLVGALMVTPTDEVFAITSVGGVIRTRAGEVKQSGRQTMGVRLMNLASGDSVVALARNAEAAVDEPVDEPVDEVTGEASADELVDEVVDGPVDGPVDEPVDNDPGDEVSD